MKQELKNRLKEISSDLRIVDGLSWNIDMFNRKTKISLKIITTNIDCSMADSRDNDDFYEFYFYEGIEKDLRNNKFIKRLYSSPKSDLENAAKIIQSVLL